MNYNSKKTHCKRGHPLIQKNLLPYELSKGIRSCKTCWQIREKQRRQSKIKKPRANQNTYKEFCKRGHSLVGDNVRIDKNGKRICKACKRLTSRNVYHNSGGKEYQLQWQRTYPEKVSKYNKKWRRKHPEYDIIWSKKNLQKRSAIYRKHEQKPERRDYRNNWFRVRYANDPNFRKQKLEQNRLWRIENPRSGAGYPPDISMAMMERRIIASNKCERARL